MPPTPKEQLALDFAAAMTKYSGTATTPVDVSDAWAAAIELYASSLGGGTATALATTGLSVNVSKAAPPAKGDALVCTNVSPLEAQWAASPPPGMHAGTHQDGGGDEVAVATGAANAIPKATKAGVLDASWGGAASSLATLDAAASVVQLPAVATSTPTKASIPMTTAKMSTLDAGWMPDAGVTKGAMVLGTDLGGTAALPNVIGIKGDLLPATAASALLGRDAMNKNWVMTAVGSVAGTVCAGDDTRLKDARTPTSHASSHTDGTDDLAVGSGIKIASKQLQADFGTKAGTVCEGNDARISVSTNLDGGIPSSTYAAISPIDGGTP